MRHLGAQYTSYFIYLVSSTELGRLHVTLHAQACARYKCRFAHATRRAKAVGRQRWRKLPLWPEPTGLFEAVLRNGYDGRLRGMRDAAEAVVEHTKLAGLRFVVCRQSVSSNRESRLPGDGSATRIIY